MVTGALDDANDQSTETFSRLVFTGERAYHEEMNQLVVCEKAVGLGCTLILHRMSSSTINHVISCDAVIRANKQIFTPLTLNIRSFMVEMRGEVSHRHKHKNVSIHSSLIYGYGKYVYGE